MNDYVHDKLSRLAQVIQRDPDGAGPLTDRVTDNDYDLLGNLLAQTDPADNTTQRATTTWTAWCG